VVHCFTDETGRVGGYGNEQGKADVNQEYIWETFDSLFKTVGRQGRRVEELEARLAELERRLSDVTSIAERAQTKQQQPRPTVGELPAERAA
jgi:hypothetical protein